jgi:hypothetical protein
MKKISLIVFTFAILSTALSAESNLEQAKNIALGFLDATEQKTFEGKAIPEFDELVMETIDAKRSYYSKGIDNKFPIDEEIIGTWEFFGSGAIENTTYGVFKTEIFLTETIRDFAEYEFHFHPDNTVEFFGDTYFWYSIDSSRIIIVQFWGSDALESSNYEVLEIHLSKIRDNEYLALLQDLYDFPLIWVDAGILRCNELD